MGRYWTRREGKESERAGLWGWGVEGFYIGERPWFELRVGGFAMSRCQGLVPHSVLCPTRAGVEWPGETTTGRARGQWERRWHCCWQGLWRWEKDGWWLHSEQMQICNQHTWDATPKSRPWTGSHDTWTVHDHRKRGGLSKTNSSSRAGLEIQGTVGTPQFYWV